jgi:hypothetical protein
MTTGRDDFFVPQPIFSRRIFARRNQLKINMRRKILMAIDQRPSPPWGRGLGEGRRVSCFRAQIRHAFFLFFRPENFH